MPLADERPKLSHRQKGEILNRLPQGSSRSRAPARPETGGPHAEGLAGQQRAEAKGRLGIQRHRDLPQRGVLGQGAVYSWQHHCLLVLGHLYSNQLESVLEIL